MGLRLGTSSLGFFGPFKSKIGPLVLIFRHQLTFFGCWFPNWVLIPKLGAWAGLRRAHTGWRPGLGGEQHWRTRGGESAGLLHLWSIRTAPTACLARSPPSTSTSTSTATLTSLISLAYVRQPLLWAHVRLTEMKWNVIHNYDCLGSTIIVRVVESDFREPVKNYLADFVR